MIDLVLGAGISPAGSYFVFSSVEAFGTWLRALTVMFLEPQAHLQLEQGGVIEEILRLLVFYELVPSALPSVDS